MKKMENENQRKHYLVLGYEEAKERIEKYLKLYNYSSLRLNIKEKVYASNINHIIQLTESYSINEMIIPSVDSINLNLELLEYFLGILIAKNINIISINDNIQIHADQQYLREVEKRLFISKSMSKKIKQINGREQIKDDFRQDNKNKRVAAYLRVSSREQTLGYSIDNQREKILMYLELFDYKNTQVDFFVDSGKSASNLKRPKMQELLEKVKKEEYDEVIVYKLDRLTRNVIDVYNLLQLFLAKNVNLIAILDNLDIKTANGRMLVGILAIIAQWERETIVERTNDGLMQIALEGKYPASKCPLGYVKDEKLFLHIDPKTEPIVKKIFYLAGLGYTYIEVENKIQEEYGYQVHRERIKRIIFEPGYYGQYHYKGYVFPEVMPAIITEEEAHDAQRMLGKRSPYGKEQSNFIFTNKIYCSKCGRHLAGIPTYKKKKKYYYYYCKECNKRINQDYIIERLLITILDKLKKNIHTSDIKKRINRINMINRKLRKITREYSENILDEEIYMGMVKELEKKIRAERNEVKLIKIDNLSWSEMKGEEKRLIVEKVIKEIRIDLEKKKIYPKYIVS